MSCRNSASCTHVSSVLRALVALTTVSSQLYDAVPSISESQNKDVAVPITSYVCQCKFPKRRKESNITMFAAVLEKHDYRKKQQQKASLIKGFDPWPVKCEASQLLFLLFLMMFVVSH